MNITPFKTTRDYDRALRRIEQLMDAKPGSKNGDELDVLATLGRSTKRNIMPSVLRPGRSDKIQNRSTRSDAQRSGSDAWRAGAGF